MRRTGREMMQLKGNLIINVIKVITHQFPSLKIQQHSSQKTDKAITDKKSVMAFGIIVLFMELFKTFKWYRIILLLNIR